MRGAIEAFLSLGASKVMVGEGPGHVRDSYYVLKESGLEDVLYEDRIPFVDLNNDSLFTLPNKARFSPLKEFSFPRTLRQVRFDCLDGKNEDPSLGRCDPFNEKHVRCHAWDRLWVA